MRSIGALIGISAAVIVLTLVGTGVIAADSQVTLVRGQNEVVYTGEMLPVEEALAFIDGRYSAVYHWDGQAQAWRTYRPGQPAFLLGPDRAGERQGLLDRDGAVRPAHDRGAGAAAPAPTALCRPRRQLVPALLRGDAARDRARHRRNRVAARPTGGQSGSRGVTHRRQRWVRRRSGRLDDGDIPTSHWTPAPRDRCLRPGRSLGVHVARRSR